MSIQAHGLSPLGLPAPVAGCACVTCERGRETCPTCGLRSPGPEHRMYEPMLCSDAPAKSRNQEPPR